jgi:hypothetical protein
MRCPMCFFLAVLEILDILVRIRIRGSVPLTKWIQILLLSSVTLRMQKLIFSYFLKLARRHKIFSLKNLLFCVKI